MALVLLRGQGLAEGGPKPAERGMASAAVGEVECSDGVDNDADEQIDFPWDAGCASPGDVSEGPTPACADGLDNDEDSATDWPEDRDCRSSTDDSEATSCADGLDDDGDGWADYPSDPDCVSLNDHDEAQGVACEDGVDNDADGLIDFPADDGCGSRRDESEQSAAVPSAIHSRIVVAVAASRSLNGDVCVGLSTGGDGSNACPGNDVDCATCNSEACGNVIPDDSRLDVLRAGLRSVFACEEIELALARSAQRGATFDCPSDSELTASGGWQGGGGSPCGGGFDSGDLLIRFGLGNRSWLGALFDGASNYDGVGTPPAGSDFELRGTGGHPLAGLLGFVGEFVADARASDAVSACRPYRVLLITDGAESCGLDEDAVAAADQLAIAGVPVNVIALSVMAPGEVAALSDVASAGGTGGAIFVSDVAGMSAALAQILEDSRLEEVCNGVDDDCDGEVDEECTIFRDGFDCAGLQADGRWSQSVP